MKTITQAEFGSAARTEHYKRPIMATKLLKQLDDGCRPRRRTGLWIHTTPSSANGSPFAIRMLMSNT